MSVAPKGWPTRGWLPATGVLGAGAGVASRGWAMRNSRIARDTGPVGPPDHVWPSPSTSRRSASARREAARQDERRIARLPVPATADVAGPVVAPWRRAHAATADVPGAAAPGAGAGPAGGPAHGRHGRRSA